MQADFVGILIFSCLVQKCIVAGQMFSLPAEETATNYIGALHACRGRVPDGQVGHDQLVAFMRYYGIERVWLGWQRQHVPWTWVNGDQVRDQVIRDGPAGHDCVSMNIDGQLSARPCNATLPVICQFDGLPCSITYAAAYCVTVRGSAYLWAPEVQGWFTARAFCRHCGGELASFPNKDIVHTVLKKLPAIKPGNYWVEARRNTWRTSSLQTEFQEMATNLWEPDQPGKDDCIVLQRVQDRAFWRTTSCNITNKVVCSSASGKSAGTITFPKLSKGDNDVKLTFYKDVSINNHSMEDLCQIKGGHTPISLKDLISNEKQIATLMRKGNITSAWLPWQQEFLSNWTWISGKSYYGIIVQDKPSVCASLDQVIGAKYAYALPCHESDAGYVCQFVEDTRPCWQTFHPYNCVKIGTSSFISGTQVQSWFVAFSLCASLGGQLAELLQQSMSETLLRFYRHHENLKATNFIHVGLHKGEWLSRNRQGFTESLTTYNLWGILEPSMRGNCSVLDLETPNALWHSENCSTGIHYLICRESFNSSPPGMMSHITEQPVTDNIVNGTEQYEKVKSNVLAISLGIALPLVIITGLATATCTAKYKAKFCLEKRKTEGETELKEVNDSAAETPLLVTPVMTANETDNIRHDLAALSIKQSQTPIMTADEVDEIRHDLAALGIKQSQAPHKPEDDKIDVTFINNRLQTNSKDTSQPIKRLVSSDKLRTVTDNVTPAQVHVIRTKLVNLDLCFNELFSFASKCTKCKRVLVFDTMDNTSDNLGIVKGLALVLYHVHSLIHIDIRDTYLGEGGRQVLSSLSCPHLRVLSLCGDHLAGCGPQLAACLTRLPLLALLELNNSGLTGEEMPGVLDSLAASCPQLVALLLGDNDLSQAADALTCAVQAKSSLQILNISRCKLESKHLLNIVKSTSLQIEYLHIWGNAVCTEVETELVRLTEQRPSLRYVAMKKVQVSAGVWDRMESVLRGRGGHLHESIIGSDEIKKDGAYLTKVRDECLIEET